MTIVWAHAGQTFLVPHYKPGLVVLSIVVAIFAAFVALDLARRVVRSEGGVARVWLYGGSIAMGSGIWAMHFVAMLAFSLPIPLGYDMWITLLSWIAAVVSSGVALYVASRPRLKPSSLTAGGLCMGAGICFMHYTGMWAMHMQPAIVWDPLLLAASVVVAVGASFAALVTFFWMHTRSPERLLMPQIGASVLMGAAIAGMHYTGMAAANFPYGSLCLAASNVSPTVLGVAVGAAAISLLTITLVTSVLDGRLQSRTANLVDSLRRANAELSRIAYRDPLTGLHNRLSLDDDLARASAMAFREHKKLPVLFIDLDGFKQVNDSLGHLAGDHVLQVVAQRLISLVRSSDTVVRLGGDEFLVLTTPTSDIDKSHQLSERLQAAVRDPILYGEHEIVVSCSIGISVFPDDGEADKLISNADMAMHHAKRAGKGTHRYYLSEMDAGSAAVLEMQSDLRQAISSGALELHYQPQIRTADGRAQRAEALLRWRHPRRGMISPGEFIPVAEHCGLILPLGDWVLETAIAQVSAWRQKGTRLPLAINLSAYQLRQADFVDRIATLLAVHKVPPGMITLEITESAAMEDAGSTLALLAELTRVGVRISIDDFGTGYSSLSYLRRFTANELKIDRSFVMDLERNEDARAIVGGVISLAHAIGLDVVAEGVESEEQRRYLTALGCDELQGYLFSAALPAREIERLFEPDARATTTQLDLDAPAGATAD